MTAQPRSTASTAAAPGALARRAPAAPLRKIVAELVPGADGFSSRKVELECGHTAWCSAGAIYRARCRKCRTAQTPG